MSFAEIVLRVGVGIGGWLIFLSHAVILASIPQADCDPSSDEMWRGTLFFALLSGVAVANVGIGLLWKTSIRPLAAIAGALALYASIDLITAFGPVFLDGQPLCILAEGSSLAGQSEGGELSTVELFWIPAQLAVLVLGIFQAARFWLPRSGAETAAGGTSESPDGPS